MRSQSRHSAQHRCAKERRHHHIVGVETPTAVSCVQLPILQQRPRHHLPTKLKRCGPLHATPSTAEPLRTLPVVSMLSSSGATLVSEPDGPRILAFMVVGEMRLPSLGFARRGNVDARFRSFTEFSNSRSAFTAFSTSLMRNALF